jgi:EAL domain-containing protein (putative c-di-GMP-specific phosphodiesterase class I)
VSLDPQRLLGFAFASADLLLEISAGGDISFAIGASEALAGSAEMALTGRGWRDFVDARDHGMLAAMLEGLRDGSRAGPIVVTLAGKPDAPARGASLSALRLPGNGGAVSCALSRAAAPPSHDLHDRVSFENVAATLAETARATGVELELAMVQFGGLGALRRTLGAQGAADLDNQLSGILRAQSHGGGAAASIDEERYALVRQRGESVEALAHRLVSLTAGGPAAHLKPAVQATALKGDASAAQLLRAVRYCLDSFIKGEVEGPPPTTLNEAVSRSIRRTLMDVGALGQAVNDRSFRLVYQPIVDLKKGGALHHHEVLVRFGDDGSPFPMIRMAEELDLIETLDLAVVEQAVAKMAMDPKLRLAVNVSGRTIGSAGFVEAIRKILAARPDVRGRLMFELTESAAIDDLAAADRHLQALRGEGCLVCLDDFGAGAASLAYLQQLSLDIVKIDGRYIRELQHGGRESTFLRHLVGMCAELGVKTLAEMVESAQTEDVVRRAGVDYAQGWHYGAASERPEPPSTAALAPVRPAARRQGATESWG